MMMKNSEALAKEKEPETIRCICGYTVMKTDHLLLRYHQSRCKVFKGEVTA